MYHELETGYNRRRTAWLAQRVLTHDDSGAVAAALRLARMLRCH
jgi:hypothetical protein